MVSVLRVEEVNKMVAMTSISFAYDLTLPTPTVFYYGIETIFDMYISVTTTTTAYFQY